MTDNSLFYIPTVSKSLLIVLGTSPCHSPQTANCSKWTPLLIKGKPTLDKRLPLAGLVLSVLRKTASALTSHHADIHCQGVCHAVCDPTLAQQGNPSHIRRTDRPLLAPACVRRCSACPLRPSARSRSESVYVRIRATIRDCERGS